MPAPSANASKERIEPCSSDPAQAAPEPAASASRSEEQPFVVRESDVRRVSALLSERVGPLTLYASFRDGSERVASSPDELFAWLASSGQTLRRLSITATGGQGEPSAGVLFSTRTGEAVLLDARGPGPLVNSLTSSLTGLVRELRPWYARFSGGCLGFWGLVAFWLRALVLLCAIGLGWRWVPYGRDYELSGWQGFLVGDGAISSLIIGGWIASWSVLRLFPIHAIAIGRAARRHRILDPVRLILVTAYLTIVTLLMASSLALELL
jgi:hypothetical protein